LNWIRPLDEKALDLKDTSGTMFANLCEIQMYNLTGKQVLVVKPSFTPIYLMRIRLETSWWSQHFFFFFCVIPSAAALGERDYNLEFDRDVRIA